MAKTVLNEDILKAAVAGGSFYGGGGGGSPELGLRIGRVALGLDSRGDAGTAPVQPLTIGDVGRILDSSCDTCEKGQAPERPPVVGDKGEVSSTFLRNGDLGQTPGRPWMLDLDDLPDDAILLTVSAVGSPAGKGSHAGPEEYARAVMLFRRQTGLNVAGLITNECGGLATVNGWIQSSATGLPIVDAPCNGRAHPTGTMGSMGLHRVPGYESLQTVVGGSRRDGTHVEVLVRGSLEYAGSVVRQAAAHTGGLVAVARNPVTVAYARKNAAVGAIAKCVEVGKAMLRAAPGSERIEAVAAASGGTVVARGTVVKKDLVSAGGFDTGTLVVEGLDGTFELTFWNEYITLERMSGTASGRTQETASARVPEMAQGRALGKALGTAPERLATFPDLIATLDADTGLPVSSADVKEGQRVAVIAVPASALILGSGVKDPKLYEAVERAVGKEVIRYAFGG